MAAWRGTAWIAWITVLLYCMAWPGPAGAHGLYHTAGDLLHFFSHAATHHPERMR